MRKLSSEQIAVQTTADKLQPLAQFVALTQAWQVAEIAVERNIGTPICMPNCGKCCEVTTVMAMDAESAFTMTWLAGQNAKMREDFISLCKGWLVDRDPGLTLYGATTDSRKLHQELQYLLFHRPCPFLTSDKRCAVHDARPLVCHAYGVTRQPGEICPRPAGINEGMNFRAHIDENSEAGIKLRQMVQKWLKTSADQGLVKCRFLATAIVMGMAPDFFNAAVADGRVASAKLAELPYTPAILFQDQLEAVMQSETQGRLVAIPNGGI
jgi:Fe-S-cluster containining protein